MPNTNRPLHIVCPKCHETGCSLVVKSMTIMTVACVSCGHAWATQIDALPSDIQERVLDVLAKR